MKILSYITILLMSASLFISCDPDDPDFKDVDTSSIDNVYNTVSGPSLVYAGTQSTYKALSRKGSDYEWSSTGVGTASKDATYGFIGNFVWPYFTGTDTVDINVVVNETTPFGATAQVMTAVRIAPYVNSIQGASEMYSGTTEEFSPESEYQGSTYTWSLTGAANASLSATEGSSVEVVTTAQDTETTATLKMVEKLASGDEVTFTKEITIKAYCAYDVSQIDGAIGGIEYDLTYGSQGSVGNYGGDYTSTATWTWDDSKRQFVIVGLVENWMQDFWGEEIQNAPVEITMSVDDLGLIGTIELSDYFQTIYDSAPYAYTLEGSALIDGCTGKLILDMTLCYDDNSSCYPFQLVADLP